MAVKSGRNGSLRITVGGAVDTVPSAAGTGASPTDALVNLRSWSIDQSANLLTVDTASMGNFATWNESYTISRAWSASFSGLWEVEGAAAAVGAEDLIVGRTVRIAVFPDNTTADASADEYYSGTAIINSLTINSSYDGMVELSLSVQGTGALSFNGSAIT